MKTDNISEKLNRVFEELAHSAQEDAKRSRKSTGFSAIDRLTTGLVDGDLIVIAGRPAMGKTAFALDIVNHLAKENDKIIAIFSLEMSAEQIIARLQKSIGIGYTKGSNLQIFDDPWMSVKKMSMICESIENLGAVIIDYIQLISSTEDSVQENTRKMEMVHISRALKLMAKNMNIPIICLSQLSRTVEHRVDKRPILSDFYDSGCLIQDADQILFLYRDLYYNPETPLGDIAECIVAKNRHGDCGTVKLRWDPEKATFSDVEVVE